jgi:hypothetical protein
MAVGHEIPHDLGQYVIEAATGYEYGFWGSVEKGATFKSTGRRLTKPGRAVVAMHRRELAASEQLAGVHLGWWKSKRPGLVSVALDRALAQWRGMGSGDRLVFDWPSAEGTVEPSGHRGTDQLG